MSHTESKNNHTCKEGESCCFKSRAILGELRTPRMVTWLVKTGFVKSETAAGKILLGVTILSFALAILISSSFFFGFSIGTKKDYKNQAKTPVRAENSVQKAY